MFCHSLFKPYLSAAAQRVHRLGKRLPVAREVRKGAMCSVAVTALVLGVRYLGGWQFFELAAFDWMMRSRPARSVDSRLLVVEISEADIAAQGDWPLSDEAFAQVLQELQRHQPAAIGLDIVRDSPNPPGYDRLVAQLQNPNVIAMKTLGNEEKQRVAAPSSIPEAQVGFNDVPTDPDGKVRRNLLFASQGNKGYASLSLQLALLYLKDKNVKAQLTEAQEYQLGNTVFPKLTDKAGGYQTLDARGYQILLDYRAENPARYVTFTQVLNGDFPADWVRGKIVLIGATAPSVKDLFFTPYSVAQGGRQMG